MKKAVFWDVAPCRSGVNQSAFNVSHGRSACGLSYNFPSALKMEAIRSSETSVNNTSTRCHNPEDCFLQIYLWYRTLDSTPLALFYMQWDLYSGKAARAWSLTTHPNVTQRLGAWKCIFIPIPHLALLGISLIRLLVLQRASSDKTKFDLLLV
jgi:hypothetical protein